MDYALPSGYDTIEGSVCGQFFFGSGVCKTSPGATLTDLKISLQGYFTGTAVVDGCGINHTQRYVDSSVITVEDATPLFGDCVLSVTLSPEPEALKGSKIVMGSFRGHVYVEMTEPEVAQDFQFDQASLAGGAYPAFKIFLDGEVTARVMIRGVGRGCNVTYEADYTAPDGNISILLKDFTPGSIIGPCIFRGFARSPTEEISIFWVVNYYKGTFVPLPEPATHWESDQKICLDADENVSWLSSLNQVKIANTGCFVSPKSQNATLRASTVGGRSTIGLWDAKSQNLKWYH